MDPETRDKLREAARRQHNNCPKCGAHIDVVDGSRIGGLPGINYKSCNGCGWSQAKTKRPGKFKL